MTNSFRITKSFRAHFLCLLGCCAFTLRAATIPTSWDFGTGSGQDDLTDFSQFGTWTLESDSARISLASTDFATFGNVTSFSDLGGGNPQDFQANLTFTITQDNSADFSRYSMIVLADGSTELNLNGTGITAEFLKNANTEDYEIALRTGLNSSRISGASAAFPGRSFDDDLSGAVISMQLNGTYSNGSLSLDLQVWDDSNNAQSLSNISVDAADYSGNYFGMGARMGSTGTTPENSLIIDYGNFAVIPEPGTLMLMGIAFASLLAFRRRARAR